MCNVMLHVFSRKSLLKQIMLTLKPWSNVVKYMETPCLKFYFTFEYVVALSSCNKKSYFVP